MCCEFRLDFVPHSGDDFFMATAINLGLLLLIGAVVSSAPLFRAAKDMWLNDDASQKTSKTGAGRFDTRIYKIFEALRSLEDQVFRRDAKLSASAYKHSTAHVLHQFSFIASPEAHPACRDLRGANEAARMKETLRRPLRMEENLGLPRA